MRRSCPRWPRRRPASLPCGRLPMHAHATRSTAPSAACRRTSRMASSRSPTCWPAWPHDIRSMSSTSSSSSSAGVPSFAMSGSTAARPSCARCTRARCPTMHMPACCRQTSARPAPACRWSMKPCVRSTPPACCTTTHACGWPAMWCMCARCTGGPAPTGCTATFSTAISPATTSAGNGWPALAAASPISSMPTTWPAMHPRRGTARVA